MLTAQQLKERVGYLGSSDAAAVLGLSRWSTPLRVWAEKTGNLQIEPKDSLAIELGELLEDAVATLFMRRSGKKVKRCTQTIYHPTHKFLAANLDRVLIGEDAILECKTAASWKAPEWADKQIPQEYAVQVLHALAVTRKKKAYLCCLVGNQTVEIREIDRDENTINQIVAKEVDFWNTYVVPKVMPFNISRRDDETLLKLFPMADEGTLVALGDNANRIIESLQSMKQDAKNLDGLISQQENELKALLQDSETGLSALYRVVWKNQKRKRVDVEALKTQFPEVAAKVVTEAITRVLKYKVREVGDGEHG